MRRPIAVRLALGFLLTLVSLLATAVLALSAFSRVFDAVGTVQEHHLREVSIFEDIRMLVSDAVGEDHAYILSGGDDVYDEAFEADVDDIARLYETHDALHAAIPLTPPEVERMRRLRRATARLAAVHDLVEELLVAGNAAEARRVSDRDGADAAGGALAAVGALVEGERREVEAVVARARDDAAGAHRLLLVVGAAASILSGAVALSVIRSIAGPVGRLLDVTRRVDRGNLGVRAGIASRDEIGELARSVDRMIGRLEAAFAEQERFLADVSHELRTPITIIRGHLEVLRRGAQAPERVERAVMISVDELDRMGRMVDDLLTLVRATRADFLAPEPIALPAFLEEVLDKAEAIAPRLWRLGPAADATVVADRDRLTQALLNLLRNAAEHTAPGQAIELRAALAGDRVEITVADGGEGIPPDLLPHVFDRFRRGEGGPTRAGLGLSIVLAIARAHGGDARAASVPGAGSAFTMALPLRPAPARVAASW